MFLHFVSTPVSDKSPSPMMELKRCTIMNVIIVKIKNGMYQEMWDGSRRAHYETASLPSVYLRCLAEVTSIASLLFQTWLMERRETQLLFETFLIERQSSSFPLRPRSLFNPVHRPPPAFMEVEKHMMCSRNKTTQRINELGNPKKLNSIKIRAIYRTELSIHRSPSLPFKFEACSNI